MAEKRDKLTPAIAVENFKLAYQWKKPFLDEASEDVEFALGKQWEDKDKKELWGEGVRALTINKIRPNIFLMKGLESQNRSEFTAFPEGKEDTIDAEIATRLLKNIMKVSGADYKISEMFEDGNTVGESHLEPWIDYPFDVRQDGTVDILGQMQTKKGDYYGIFPEPGNKEYDYSDCEYVCKITYDLSLDQMIKQFPDKEKKLREMGSGKINVDIVQSERVDGVIVERRNYSDDNATGPDSIFDKKSAFDLLDYYYKKYIPRYFIADHEAKIVKLAKDEAEADNFVAERNRGVPDGEERARKIKRFIPEIWVGFTTGDEKEFLAHDRAWSSPRWKGYPFFAYFCYRSTLHLPLNAREYAVQGMVRPTKDLNRELNKRRTQELRHLNQSANSGWLAQDGAFKDIKKAEKFGSAPGVVLLYKEGFTMPKRIEPTPLSQGHAQLAAEHGQDMKEALGINTDLLAMQEGGQASGRAIALRQKQGMVMIQGPFDNLSQTKRNLARFFVSQFNEVYDLEKAVRVLGEAFVTEHFSKLAIDQRTGQPPVDPSTGEIAIDPSTGQPPTEIDQEQLAATINKVLNDSEFNTYDVSVGENISNETIQFGNFITLTELAGQGIPIPPDVLIEESTLSQASKKRIQAAFQAQAQAESTPGGKQNGKT